MFRYAEKEFRFMSFPFFFFPQVLWREPAIMLRSFLQPFIVRERYASLVCYRQLGRSIPKRILPVPRAAKLITVAIVGSPNVGKSVLINSLVKERLAAATRKKHTTRGEILGVYNHRNVQLAFYDSPGYVSSTEARNEGLKSLRAITTSVMAKVDVVLLVVDASRELRLADQDIFAEMAKLALQGAKEEVILILNKVDLVEPKTKLLDLTYSYVSLINGVKYGPGGEKKSNLDTTTFMISALEKDGVIDLKNYLISLAKPSEWILPREDGDDMKNITDLSPEERIEEMVLENMLENCHDELPYIADITCMSITPINANMLKIEVDIRVDTDGQRRIVIGHQGRTLVKLRQSSVEALEVIFKKKIILQFFVALRK